MKLELKYVNIYKICSRPGLAFVSTKEILFLQFLKLCMFQICCVN